MLVEMRLLFVAALLVMVGIVSAVELKVDFGDAGTLGDNDPPDAVGAWTQWAETSGSKTIEGITFTLSNGGLNNGAKIRDWEAGSNDQLTRDAISEEDPGSGGWYQVEITGLTEGASYRMRSYHNNCWEAGAFPTTSVSMKLNAGEVDTANLSERQAYTSAGVCEHTFTASAGSDTFKWDFAQSTFFNGFILQTANPSVQFESAASGDFETVSPAVLTVILSEAQEQIVTVDYAVTGGTATGGGVDYELAGACSCDFDGSGQVNFHDLATFVDNWLSQTTGNIADVSGNSTVDFEDFATLGLEWYDLCGGGTLRFEPGETAKTISIDIINDGLDEENETILVELSNLIATSGEVELGANAQHTYTIFDPRPRVSFATAASSVSEGATVANVEVSLSPASWETATVDYSVTGGTATGSGVDYSLANGTLTFGPSQTTQNVSITIIDDDLEEGSETIEITLSNPSSNALLGTRLQHTFTIDDNESVVVLEEFVGGSFSNFNHSSTIAETHNGTLVVAWYGGSSEGAGDVSILVSTDDGSGWSPRMEVDNGSGDATWNPVLFQPSTGPLLLYYKYSGSPSSWRGAVRESYDDGQTWSSRILLPTCSDPYLSAYGGRFVGPVKNRPIELPDGSLLCGSSTEHDGWQVHMEIARGDYTNDFELIGPLGPIEGIQPTFLVHDDGYQTIQALCRAPGSGRATPTTWSYDGGQTWTSLSTISLETSKGIHAVTINNLNQMKTRWHILAYNPSGRYPLRIATSQDGMNWDVAIDNVAPGDGSMDYPTIMQTSDKMLHLVFSWSNHSKIRHIVLNPYVLLGESP